MPELARFFGIITKYFNDHPPPHIHARYGQQRAVVSIETLAVLEGSLSPRVLRLVMEWIALHRSELRANSTRAEQHVPLTRIPPLEQVAMLIDIVEVRPLAGFRLFLRFEDGTAGDVDLKEFVRFDGVFSPLLDPVEFARVRVDAELGTIVWPSGADLCPDVLYSRITGATLPGGDRKSASA